MAKPGMTFTTWTQERNPAWAKETPNYNNLVIAGAILDVDAFATALGVAAGDPVTIPGGTLVMRALADRDDGPFIPFADAGYDATTHEAYLTYHGIYDANTNDEVTLYRHERVVAYNKLPDWDTTSAEAQGVIHANYQTMAAAE